MNNVVRELKAIFGFDLDGSSVRNVDRAIERSRGRLQSFDRAQHQVNDGLGSMIRQAAVLYGGGMLARAFWDANQGAQSLKASLTLATGSADAAADAMTRVREFATVSPDDVLALGDAYQMLLAQGLEPTEERMTRIGDTAAALQIPMSELLDAVAGGTIGNLERLDMAFRRFGANFMSRNGVVSVTMNGVTRELGSSFEELAGFVEELGAGQFAGQMARQANTLAGRASMMRDAFTNMLISMGESTDLNDAIQDLINTVTDLLGDSTQMGERLGGIVADGVRRLNDVLGFVRDNSEALGPIFIALGSSAVTGPLMRAADAVLELDGAMLVTKASAMATWGAIALLITGTVLAIDDFVAFMQGRPSVIGAIVGQHYEQDGALGGFARMMEDIKTHGADAFSIMRDDIDRFNDRMSEIGQNINKIFRDMYDRIEEVGLALRAVLPEPVVQAWDDFAASVNRLANALDRLRESSQYLQNFADISFFDMTGFGLIAGASEAIVPNSSGGPRVDANGNPITRQSRRQSRRERNADAAIAATRTATGARADRGRTGSRETRVDAPVRIENINVQAPPGADPGAFGEAVGDGIRRSFTDQIRDAFERAQTADVG